MLTDIHALGIWLFPCNVIPRANGGSDKQPLRGHAWKDERYDPEHGLAGCTHWAWIPATGGWLVVDVDYGDAEALVSNWPKRAFRILPSGSPGRAHVVVAWLASWGDQPNADWSRAGCSGQIRHANGWCVAWDLAKLYNAIVVNPPDAHPEVRRIVGDMLKAKRAAPGALPSRAEEEQAPEPGTSRRSWLYKMICRHGEARADEFVDKAINAPGFDHPFKRHEAEREKQNALTWLAQRREEKSVYLKRPDLHVDLGNADSVARQHMAPIEYVQGVGKWFERRDDGWSVVLPGQAQDVLSDWAWHAANVLGLDDEGRNRALREFSKTSDMAMKRIAGRAMLTERDIDRDPDVVGLPNGEVYDLAQCEQRPMRDDDGIVRKLGVMPREGDAPTWAALLGFAIPNDAERAFLRDWWKRSLSGHVGRTAWIVALTDKSGAGKSLMLEILKLIGGDLVASTQGKNFVGQAERTGWLLDLAAARMGLVEEVPPGKWSGQVKSLASGDLVMGRKLYGEESGVMANVHLTLTCNQLPTFQAADGFARRVVPVRFDAPLEAPRDGAELDDRVAALGTARGAGIEAWSDGAISLTTIGKELRAEAAHIAWWLVHGDMHACERLPDSIVAERAALEIENAPLENALREVATRAPIDDETVTVAQVKQALLASDATTRRWDEVTDRTVASALRAIGFKTAARGRQLVVMGCRVNQGKGSNAAPF